MNEYISDLVAGEIGGPGLVDGVGSLLAAGDITPANFWNPVMNSFKAVIVWFLESMPSVSGWIRGNTFVMALVGIFFVGFCVAVFMRVYHQIL